MAATDTEQAPKENWFRPLKDDRLEVCLKVGEHRMRASGPEADVWTLVEHFEELTGVAVEGDWKRPPRRGPRPAEGQLDLTTALEQNGEE